MANPEKKAKKKRRPRGEGSIFRRSSDGMWVARVVIPGTDGRTAQTTAKSHADLLAKRRDLLKAIEHGVDPHSGTQTVEKWMNHWLDQIAKPRVSPGTLTTYRAAVSKHIVPAIGRKRLNKLTPADIRAMLTRSKDNGASDRTAQSAFAVLRKALTDAEREGLIIANPAKRMDPPRARAGDRGHLDAAAFRTLVQHITQLDPATCSRISMSLFTGARQAECLGLEWDRIDWTNKVIDVSWTLRRLPLRKTFDRTGVGDLYPPDAFDVGKADYEYRPVWRGWCLTQPKTESSRRIVPMIPPLEAALRLWWTVSGQPATGLVWTRPDGAPIRDYLDTALWKDTLIAAGLVDDQGKPITLHAARHTLATLLLEAGIPEDVRMQIVGHSSVAAQRIYAHVDQTQTRAALGELTKLLGPPS